MKGPGRISLLLLQGLGQLALTLALATEFQKFLPLLKVLLASRTPTLVLFCETLGLLCFPAAVDFRSYPDSTSLTCIPIPYVPVCLRQFGLIPFASA